MSEVVFVFVESAKLRAVRAKNVLACQRASRANVPCVLTCFAFLRAHVPTCLACLCAHVPTCLACSRANVLCLFTCQLSCVLKCSRANVP